MIHECARKLQYHQRITRTDMLTFNNNIACNKKKGGGGKNKNKQSNKQTCLRCLFSFIISFFLFQSEYYRSFFFNSLDRVVLCMFSAYPCHRAAVFVQLVIRTWCSRRWSVAEWWHFLLTLYDKQISRNFSQRINGYQCLIQEFCKLTCGEFFYSRLWIAVMRVL
jgi:hypothetical protein